MARALRRHVPEYEISEWAVAAAWAVDGLKPTDRLILLWLATHTCHGSSRCFERGCLRPPFPAATFAHAVGRFERAGFVMVTRVNAEVAEVYWHGSFNEPVQWQREANS